MTPSRSKQSGDDGPELGMPEVRRVESGETPEGETAYAYELGAEIGGLWVPFFTASSAHVDTAIAAAQHRQENADAKANADAPKAA